MNSKYFMAFYYLTKMDLHVSRSCPTENYPLKKCAILTNTTHSIYVHGDSVPHFSTAIVCNLKTKWPPPGPRNSYFPWVNLYFSQ